MSTRRDYPFADLTDDELRALVATSHALRARAALDALAAGWRHLRWLFAPAGKPWREVFRRPPAFTPDPPRAHC